MAASGVEFFTMNAINRLKVIQIILERYPDFGPTLACEKLIELHGVIMSKETVRKLMVHAGCSAIDKAFNERVEYIAAALPQSCLGKLFTLK